MALTLDATVGGANANSYVTRSEADSYHDARIENTTWTNASNNDKERALVMATRLLDFWVRWDGLAVQSTQALLWPRLDVLDRFGVEFSSTVIPQWLKDATAELALWLLVEDRTADSDTKGFTELKVGSLFLKVDKHDRRHILPEAVRTMVQWYGTVRSASNSNRRLVRV